MLENCTSREWYQGWTSAYTIESILIQLQSFLFETTQESLNAWSLRDLDAVSESDTSKMTSTKLKYKKEIEEANSFKCT
jgi:ubiquitin-protein ligase